MRYVLTILLLFASLTDPVTRIAKVNGLKKDAKEAMEQAAAPGLGAGAASLVVPGKFFGERA